MGKEEIPQDLEPKGACWARRIERGTGRCRRNPLRLEGWARNGGSKDREGGLILLLGRGKKILRIVEKTLIEKGAVGKRLVIREKGRRGGGRTP